MKNLHFFSHWTFREGLQALRCEKRCKVFFGGIRVWVVRVENPALLFSLDLSRSASGPEV
jgi:hypothetical protein